MANKGKNLTREDISILLAQHLKTIEKLQQVQQTGRLHDSGDSPTSSRQPGRARAVENKRLLAKRPASATKLRKLTHRRPDSPATPKASELPHIDRSKGNNCISQSQKLCPILKGDYHDNSCGQPAGVTCIEPSHTAQTTNENELVGLKNIEVGTVNT